MSCDPASNYGWALVLCMAKALAMRMQAAVLPACMRNLNAQFSLARPCTAKFDAHIPVFLTSLFLYFPTTQNSLNGRLATALFQIKVKHPSGGLQICGTAASHYGFVVSGYGELPDTLEPYVLAADGFWTGMLTVRVYVMDLGCELAVKV